jgi:hypothetical protein
VIICQILSSKIFWLKVLPANFKSLVSTTVETYQNSTWILDHTCEAPSNVAAADVGGIFNGTIVDPVFGDVGTDLSGIGSEACPVKGSLSVVLS